MGDQLARRRALLAEAPTLPLSLPAPSPLPGRIRPELAVPCSSPFDAPGWWFSVDWEGMRALLFCAPDAEPRLQDERLGDRSALFPEVIEAARGLGARSLVLDGVLTVLDPQGRSDLAALTQLMTGGGAGVSPVYLVTDLLHLDGAPVLTRPLSQRLETLRGVLGADACIQLPEWVTAEGIALAQAAQQRGLPAVLARDSTAPYRPGVAAPSRLSVALEQRATAALIGVELRAHRVAAVQLAEYADGRLVAAGRCEVQLERRVETWLRLRAEEHRLPGPPCDLVVAEAGTRWLRPQLTATVAHRGRGRDGRLRGMRLVAVRDDADPQLCVRREPVEPPVDAQLQAFRPAVLQGLPLDES